ncbi:phage tail tape measure protein [Pediococcus ethanolidurans]|uniref:phage tail tape measure protein n=1 Tax=Pediococcus ethanolidurans TaxID=319653 RepID=UPI001C1EA45C|nr:phage tail tape measure protein [Pediococcus ethanolidurans]MBU7554442.1 phage tail tape measure protein [Pediococcus ethanolidurans]
MGETAGLNFDVFLDDHGMKRSMQELKSTATMLKSEMRANFAELKSGGQITDAYAGKVKDSERAIKAQNNIIADAEKAQKGLNLQTAEGRTEFAKQEKIITSAKNSITSLTGEQNRAKSSLEYYKSGMADMNKAMKVASSASETYVSRLRAEGKENEANREQLTGLHTKYDQMSEIYDKQEKELKQIASASGKTSEAYLKQKTRLDQTGKAMAETRMKTKSLNKSTGGLSKTMARVADKGALLSKSLNSAGKKAIAFGRASSTASLAVGAGFVYGSKKAIELQNSFKQTTNLIKNGGETQKAAIAGVNKMQNDAAADAVKYGKSQKSIADGYQALVKRGYSSKQALGAMRSELQASVASGDDFKDVVSVSSQTLEAFGLRTKSTAGMIRNTKKVTNQLAYAADLTSTGFSDLGVGMSYVGSTAHQAGFSLSETASAMGLLSNNGLEADKAGTGLRKAINSLISPTKGGTSALKAMNLSTKDFIDKKGNMKSMTDIFGLLKSHTEGMSKNKKTNLFHSLFGTTGQQAGLILAQNADQLGKLNDQVARSDKQHNGKGYVATLASQNMKTAQNQLAKFKQAGEAVSIMFAKNVLPYITKIAVKLAGILDGIGKMSPKVQKLTVGFGLVLAAISPVSFAIGGISKGIGASISGLKTMVNWYGKLNKKMTVSTNSREVNNGTGFRNQWKKSSKLGKIATVAVGVKAVYDASTDIAKGMKERNKDKKLKDYGKGAGKIIGTAIGFSMAGPLGALAGGALGTKFASGFISSWEKYQKKHPLKVSQVKGGEGNQVVYEWNKGISGDIDSKQRKKEGIVNNVTDPRMLANAVGYGVGDVGYWTGKTGKGISSAWDFMNKQNKKNDKKTSQGIQSVWKWLTTNQNPGKGSKTITMPKITFPRIKTPKIWTWLTTNQKPTTKKIKSPKFEKIKWPSLPKWMNWKNWKWPKFKAPKIPKFSWPSLPKWMNWKNWHWPKFKTPKMPRIKWPKMPNLAKPWKSETGKLSRNFDKWKKSFSKSWKKHWRSTKGTLSSSWKSMKKNTNNWGNNTKKWFSSFKKSFSKSWKKHWRSTRNYLGNRWNDMRKKSGSWGTSMEKWRKSFSSTFKKGFYSLGSGIHGIWSNMWGGLHKLAKKGMKGVVGIINDGINGIDGVIHRFGGRKYAIKPIHFATGTGSLSSNFRKSIDRVTPAIVNDEPGAKNPELIYRKASDSVEYSTQKNAHTVLMPGDEVANARDSATFGVPHFAKGGIGSFFSGIGSAISNTFSGVASTVKKDASWLKKLFKTAVKIIKHPIKSVESLFKYTKGSTKGVFQQISKGAFGKVESSAKSWWSKLWSMVNPNKGKSSKTSAKGIKGQVGSGFFSMIKKLANKFGISSSGSYGNPAGDSVSRWKPLVKKALAELNLSTSGSMVAKVLRQISTESGGNPKAMGGTDGLNDGHAEGLMQVKPGTFAAYSKGGSIWNGYSNIVAGLNYAMHRYGKSLSFLGNGHGYANGGFSNVAKLTNISEGNKLESIIPLSKPSRAWELIGKSAAYLDKKNNSHTTSANTSEDNSAYLQKLITQNSQLINQIGQFMQLVQAKPMGITSQQIYNVNKRQAAIQTNKYNRSLGLR